MMHSAKNKINKIKKLLVNSDYRFLKLAEYGYYNNMSDKEYIMHKFKAEMGYELSLENPKTFNEKLQWLKLYDRKDVYTSMVDKYEVKKYVSNIVGEKYIIPTYGVWNSFSEIDFQSLPDQFVLKCTHDSGGLIICKQKSNFDYISAKKKIEKCLKRNFYYQGREWPYKNVKPRILAEEYLDDKTEGGIKDYKFFCFDGIPKLMFVASDRQKENDEVKFDFFDMNFNHLEIKNGHPYSKECIDKPECFDEMKKLASTLSKGIPQLRVDFYEINHKVYFGELTFFQHSGFCPFDPIEWDFKMGNWIKLPERAK